MLVYICLHLNVLDVKSNMQITSTGIKLQKCILEVHINVSFN